MPQTPALAGASAVGHPLVATMTLPSVPSLAPEAGWRATVAGWLMVIGSAVAILGFLLPWSRTVNGAEGAGTYFDARNRTDADSGRDGDNTLRHTHVQREREHFALVPDPGRREGNDHGADRRDAKRDRARRCRGVQRIRLEGLPVLPR